MQNIIPVDTGTGMGNSGSVRFGAHPYSSARDPQLHFYRGISGIYPCKNVAYTEEATQSINSTILRVASSARDPRLHFYRGISGIYPCKNVAYTEEATQSISSTILRVASSARDPQLHFYRGISGIYPCKNVAYTEEATQSISSTILRVASTARDPQLHFYRGISGIYAAVVDRQHFYRGMAGGEMNLNLALCAAAGGAGSAGSHIYSMDPLCPNCPNVNKVMSRPEDLLLWKKLSCSDIENSHGLYIRKGDEHRVPRADLPFFDERMEYKLMHFNRGNKYYLKGKGWKKFVNDKMLQEGDMVRIFGLKCQSCEKFRGFMMKAYNKFLNFDVTK
ncbi:hypothetical protein CJ030_MR4G020947 [Morella rubra]|uniref:TF-B3 domain-containing protein n=1 Tax=Morella rubra TaxID=262757 RepID=A0A6A1VWL9_9ROSI|nr:hypothetical protein CJ030_MR4G020947 [Morella rubra]